MTVLQETDGRYGRKNKDHHQGLNSSCFIFYVIGKAAYRTKITDYGYQTLQY